MIFRSHALEPAGLTQNLALQRLREIREHQPGSGGLLTLLYRLLSSLRLGLTYGPAVLAAGEAEHVIRGRSMSAKAGHSGSDSPVVQEG